MLGAREHARRRLFRAGLAARTFDGTDLLPLRGVDTVGPLAGLELFPAAAPATASTGVALHGATIRAGDVDSLLLAALLNNVELDLLTLVEGAEAGRHDGRLVDEELIAPIVGRNEAEALLRVEPEEEQEVNVQKGIVW